MVWKYESGMLVRTRSLRTTTATPLLIIGGLVFALLTLSACQQESPPLASGGSTPTLTSRSAQIAQNTTPTLISSPTLTSGGSTPTPTNKSAQISQSITPTPTRKPILTNHGITSTPARSSTQRNHIPPGTWTLFARITFTTPTTYDQAVAILTAAEGSPYPWTCDDPRTPTPPPLAQLRAAFASSHQLLVSYPSDSLLNQLASLSQVVSVDAAPLSMCP